MKLPLQQKTIQVNGTELHYIEQGTGDPVVFVHGSLSDFRSWEFQMEPFSKRYRVIAYSRRYHYPNGGASEATAYLAIEHRDDLAVLIRELELAPAHVVGSSYGAYLSLLLAVAHPELVRSLVLADPPALSLLGPERATQLATQVLGPAREAFASGDAEQGVQSFLEGGMGKGSFDRLPPPVRTIMQDNAAEMLLETNTPIEQHFSSFTCEDASTIQAPALLLTGERNTQFHVQIADKLEQCLPKTERAMIPGAFGGLHTTNPHAYNETVLVFLAKQ
jgi:non-heme chloroperoxidase